METEWAEIPPPSTRTGLSTTVFSLDVSPDETAQLPTTWFSAATTRAVWGWSAPGADVTVKFAGQKKSTRAGADGKWLVKLGKLKASDEPQTLIVEAGETKIFTNILVGEVWLASGQSNMEKPIGKQRGAKTDVQRRTELAAANFPHIRIFQG